MDELLARVRACRICEESLEPRPVLRVSAESRILLIGQAPGSKVHASGVPWDDASGERLLDWLGVSREVFSDPASFGVLPMGFCYPGRGASGDKPPPPICAETWHDELVSRMKPALTLLVGQYAQKQVLGPARGGNLTETVRAWRDYGDRLPLPHPSWRVQGWMKRNAWFSEEVLPGLRVRVAEALAWEGRRSGGHLEPDCASRRRR
jgi:uracil-DNA glycosylase